MAIRCVVCLEMCGNFSTNPPTKFEVNPMGGLSTNGETAAWYIKEVRKRYGLIAAWPKIHHESKFHNEYFFQVRSQSDGRFIRKFAETAKAIGGQETWGIQQRKSMKLVDFAGVAGGSANKWTVRQSLKIRWSPTNLTLLTPENYDRSYVSQSVFRIRYITVWSLRNYGIGKLKPRSYHGYGFFGDFDALI